jgi:tripartite-type tricarboxylate transporter receptor subunit TctC
MKNKMISLTIGTLIAGMFTAGIGSISAVANDGFYKGKTLKAIVRSGAGGGYDYYARLVMRYMVKYIPGKPSVIVINMPGAGGIVAANYLMNRAKRGGIEFGLLSRELAISQRTSEIGVRYDTMKLIAIGSAASSTSVVIMAKDHPVKTLAQLKVYDGEVKLAATGPGSGSYQRAMLLKMDGFPVRPITGYLSTPERFLAVARGETQGTSNSFESTRKQIKELGMVPIAYLGVKRAELKGVPDLRTALSAKGRQFANLLAAPLSAGRPFFTTPGVSSDHVKMLRAAFKSALFDPELLREAKRAGRSITWLAPTEMESIYRGILASSDEVVALFSQAAKKPKVKLGKMILHSGPVTKIKKGGRRITISYKGKDVTAKVSGSRTKVMLNGKKVKRKKIKVGMNCAFTYPKPGKEAVKVDCK